MAPLVRACTIGLILSLLIPLREAAAHPRLVKADPGAGARVIAPRAVTLRFSEPLTVALCRVTLLDAFTKAVALGEVKSVQGDPKAVSVAIRGTIAPGRYTVKWLAAGDDGHPVRGEYTFDVVRETAGTTERTPGIPIRLAGFAVATPLPGVAGVLRASMAPVVATAALAMLVQSPDQSEFSVESPAYVVLRAVQSVAVIALLGILALHFTIGPRFAREATPSGHASLRVAEQTAARWIAPTLTLLLVVTVGRLFAQHVALFGANERPTMASVSAILFQSPWGRGWLVAGAAIALGLVGARRLRSAGSAGWMLVATATLGIVSSMAMSGHAAAVSAFAMTVHAAHIFGAGGWIGSLGIMVLVAVPAVPHAHDDERHAIIAGLMRAFSPTALSFAGLVAVTGVFAAWRNVGAASALWQSRYGQVLLVKLAFLSIAAAVGFFNWRRVLPVLGTDVATARLRASAAIELAAALVVLVVTAMLVATPMPAEMLDPMAP